jgi:hypothetical protein
MREYLIPIFVVAALALAGCNKSKSPEDVSKDVANAEQKANNEVTKSEEHAQSALDKSYEKVNDQEIKFNNDATHQTYNVAVAKADGNRKVALATCESQSGDAQRVQDPERLGRPSLIRDAGNLRNPGVGCAGRERRQPQMSMDPIRGAFLLSLHWRITRSRSYNGHEEALLAPQSTSSLILNLWRAATVGGTRRR